MNENTHRWFFILIRYCWQARGHFFISSWPFATAFCSITRKLILKTTRAISPHNVVTGQEMIWRVQYKPRIHVSKRLDRNNEPCCSPETRRTFLMYICASGGLWDRSCRCIFWWSTKVQWKVAFTVPPRFPLIFDPVEPYFIPMKVIPVSRRQNSLTNGFSFYPSVGDPIPFDVVVNEVRCR